MRNFATTDIDGVPYRFTVTRCSSAYTVRKKIAVKGTAFEINCLSLNISITRIASSKGLPSTRKGIRKLYIYSRYGRIIWIRDELPVFAAYSNSLSQ